MPALRAAALQDLWHKTGETIARSSLRICFPRDSVEAPPEKLPEGRHYREFFHEGAQEFCIDFLSILVTFWSPGVLLATLGASLGPGFQFLMNFETLLISPGPPRATLGGPCGPHGASWCRPGPHF